jgi:hypothetical protein
MGMDIRKGGYSGPTIGSTTSYAPNNLIPLGIYGARQQQLKDAAAKKAKSVQDFFAAVKAPDTTRFSVQAELDDKFYSGLNQWIPVLQQRYGDNWTDAAASDTQFQQWRQNMETTAKYNTGMMDNAARIEALQNDKEFVVSAATLKANRDMVAGMGGLFDPTPFGSASNSDLATKLLQVNAEVELDTAVNEAITKFANDPSGGVYQQGGGGIYDSWVTWQKTGMSDEQAESLANSIWADRYGGQSEIYTKDMIKQRLKDIFPEKVKREIEFVDNQLAGADGTNDVYAVEDITTGTTVNTDVPVGQWMKDGKPVPAGTPGAAWVSNKDKDGNTVKTTVSATSQAGVVMKRTVTRNVAQGSNMYDFSTGGMIRANGQEKMTVGEVQVMPVNKQGAVISDKDMNDYYSKHPEMWSYEVMAIGSYTPVKVQEDKATGKPMQVASEPVTVAKPASELNLEQNVNGMKKGPPIEELQARAAKLNAERQAAPAQNTQPAQPANQPKQQSGAIIANTAAEWDAKWPTLKPGEVIIGPDGKTYTK